jgi:hypothetical protein
MNLAFAFMLCYTELRIEVGQLLNGLLPDGITFVLLPGLNRGLTTSAMGNSSVTGMTKL